MYTLRVKQLKLQLNQTASYSATNPPTQCSHYFINYRYYPNSDCIDRWSALLYITANSTYQNRVRRGREVRVSDSKCLGPSPLWVRDSQGVRTLFVRKPSSCLVVGQWFYPVVRLCNSDGCLGSSFTWGKPDVSQWLQYCRNDVKPNTYQTNQTYPNLQLWRFYAECICIVTNIDKLWHCSDPGRSIWWKRWSGSTGCALLSAVYQIAYNVLRVIKAKFLIFVEGLDTLFNILQK